MKRKDHAFEAIFDLKFVNNLVDTRCKQKQSINGSDELCIHFPTQTHIHSHCKLLGAEKNETVVPVASTNLHATAACIFFATGSSS